MIRSSQTYNSLEHERGDWSGAGRILAVKSRLARIVNVNGVKEELCRSDDNLRNSGVWFMVIYNQKLY